MAGNKALLAALSEEASYIAEGPEGPQWSTHWSLQHHDADRGAWVEVGRFPTEKVAHLSRDALVAHGHGIDEEYRVRKVTIAP